MEGGIKFYFNGEGSNGGTGFILNKILSKHVISFKTYSHRISKIVLKLPNRRNGRWKIIQVYAPTSDSSEDESNHFYCLLQSAIDEDNCRYTFIVGDWNAKIGQPEGEEAVGMFGLGQRNERGDKMATFIESNSMFVMNTFFQKQLDRKWTWASPDGITKNEIDYVVSNRKYMVLDVDTDMAIKIGSDHRAIKAVLQMEKSNNYNNSQKQLSSVRINLEYLKSRGYDKIINKNLETNVENNNPDENIEQKEIRILNAIKQSSDEIWEKSEKKKRKMLPKEIRKLMSKRRKMKIREKGSNEYSEISKLIRKTIKEWSNKKYMEELKSAIENGTSLKKCMQAQRIGKKEMVALKDENGEVKKESEEMLDIIYNFYKKLYNQESSKLENELEVSNSAEKGLIVEKIGLDEVEFGIKLLKAGKTGGIDGIVNEELKAGGTELNKALCELFNLVLKEKKVPHNWLVSKLILLFKKGDKQAIQNYRPINLLSTVYKLFMGIITRRINSQLDFNSPEDQVGFKKNFSTSDAIFVVQ